MLVWKIIPKHLWSSFSRKRHREETNCQITAIVWKQHSISLSLYLRRISASVFFVNLSNRHIRGQMKEENEMKLNCDTGKGRKHIISFLLFHISPLLCLWPSWRWSRPWPPPCSTTCPPSGAGSPSSSPACASWSSWWGSRCASRAGYSCSSSSSGTPPGSPSSSWPSRRSSPSSGSTVGRGGGREEGGGGGGVGVVGGGGAVDAPFLIYVEFTRTHTCTHVSTHVPTHTRTHTRPEIAITNLCGLKPQAHVHKFHVKNP